MAAYATLGLMVEGIVATVVGGLILATVLGVVAVARRRVGGTPVIAGLRSRSDVRFLAKVTDFGNPPPNFITWRVGLVLDVEVHVLRTHPIRITEVGLELRDGKHISLDTATNLNKPIAAPDFVVASGYLQSVRKKVAEAGSPVRGFYAIATPARTLRQSLPGGWKGFPEVIPLSNSK